MEVLRDSESKIRPLFKVSLDTGEQVSFSLVLIFSDLTLLVLLSLISSQVDPICTAKFTYNVLLMTLDRYSIYLLYLRLRVRLDCI